MVSCSFCPAGSAVLRRSYSGLPSCRDCFVASFERDVYEYIERENLIADGDRVCVGVSGGKDSVVLAHVLSRIRARHARDWTLYLLAIDEGIRGYRDDSLRVVKAMDAKYGVELKILNFRDRFGFTMDEVVALIGKRNNCTVCGSFRRQMLEVGSRLFGANVLCTGHNADDMAETVLLNLFRGDLYKLARPASSAAPAGCTDCAGAERGRAFRRIKPLKYTFEKEIVLYARFLGLEYFSTECLYAPEAYRGRMRAFVKNLEVISPRIIINIVNSGDKFVAEYTPIDGKLGSCRRCGISNVRDVCKPCVIIERLNMLKASREAEGSPGGGDEEAGNEPRCGANGAPRATLNGDREDGKDSRAKAPLKPGIPVSKVLLSDKAFQLSYEHTS